MTTSSEADAAILAEIDAAFGSVERPEHFTCEDGDFEQMDKDAVLHAWAPETLPLEEAYNPGYNLWTECLPQGYAWYFPALVRFALQKPVDEVDGWIGEEMTHTLGSAGSENRFLSYCNPSQRLAVVRFLQHLMHSRSDAVRRTHLQEDLTRTLERWRA